MTTSRFDTATSKLVRAFIKGELSAGECNKCAVGNICDNNRIWSVLFMTGDENQKCVIDDPYEVVDSSPYSDDDIIMSIPQARAEAFRVIENTGYNAYQLAEVEYIFENETPDDLVDAQFNGLCAVIEKLAEFDNIDLNSINSVKHQLRQHPDLVES